MLHNHLESIHWLTIWRKRNSEHHLISSVKTDVIKQETGCKGSELFSTRHHGPACLFTFVLVTCCTLKNSCSLDNQHFQLYLPESYLICSQGLLKSKTVYNLRLTPTVKQQLAEADMIHDMTLTFQCSSRWSTRSRRPGRIGNRWACGGRCCTGGTAPLPRTNPPRHPRSPPSHSPRTSVTDGADGGREAPSRPTEGRRTKHRGSGRAVGVPLRPPCMGS